MDVKVQITLSERKIIEHEKEHASKVKMERYTEDLTEIRWLQTKIKLLEDENSRLRSLLAKAGIEYTATEKATYQTEKVQEPSITIEDARKFFSYFWGRMDVYSRRVENKKTGRAGYFPQCNNFWKFGVCPKADGTKTACKNCKNRVWTKLTPDKIVEHLLGNRANGSDVIGIYPLFPDGTTRFLVFDFDNHEEDGMGAEFETANCKWTEEVDALREICRINDIPSLVERSRSGKGAHLWIFFEAPVEASLARNFGFALLEKGAESVNLKNFRYYDRMLPAQDTLPEGGLGNLIALPLQGLALKNGNSAFVDENWQAYKNQWETLLNTKKLTKQQLSESLDTWRVRSEIAAIPKESEDGIKPWERKQNFCAKDISGALEITLANAVYIATHNLKPRLQNQLRKMAAFANPSYFKNLSMNISNYANPRYIYLGEDEDGYISIPRGLFEKLLANCIKAGIDYKIEDKRVSGKKLKVTFAGELRDKQKEALETMLRYDNGILCAATAFGKTVVCARLIAERKVNTLILLESSVLVEQWEKALLRFLCIDAELPKYVTKCGHEKVRKSLIGKICGAQDASTGIIDIAMAGSLCKKGEMHPKLEDYGMVIVDECHHSASETVSKILKAVKARYVYGVSATPFREDGLEKANYMLLGDVRYKYSAKDIAAAQGIARTVIPRFTRAVCTQQRNKSAISDAYKALCENGKRNSQIVEDTVKCLAQGRNPIVLTKFRDHAEKLYELLKGSCKNTFILTGNLSARERKELNARLEKLAEDEQLLLIATGQLAGEGFDCPRLDTLIMAMPVAWKGLVEQYAGRLNREYAGKSSVVIYDYVDSNIPVFDRMYLKRLKAYKQIGYSLAADIHETVLESTNAIFEAADYSAVYNGDLGRALKEIVISSPTVAYLAVNNLLRTVKAAQERGVKITLVTWHPDAYIHGNDEHRLKLLEKLYEHGINIVLTHGTCSKCAVIDNETVWYGNISLLSKAGEEDNIMRLKSREIAEELLAAIFRKDQKLENYATAKENISND